ncbi:MAG TPA: class I SAM-dependent methyltransferase, partial [Roseiflexaceae bacterium]|nr:class I SAM-dependent methyltransferase [Roseiflexaceae bacterium]
FDFALIDGDHERKGVIKDIEGVLPLMANGAYLVFHDAYYYGVADGIDRMLNKHKKRLTDCGMISTEQTVEGRTVKGRPVIWGGLRMLRYHAPTLRQPLFPNRLTAGLLRRNRPS